MSARRRPDTGGRARDMRGRPGGIGRRTSPAAEAVSDYWRLGSDEFVVRRRRIAGLSLASIGALGVVGLYQTGLIKKVPEPPLPFLDADRVDASGEAYKMFLMPDAVLGIGSAAVTLGLAALGSAKRAEEQPWIPLALAAKLAMDAAWAGLLTVEQVSKHRALCSWCLAAAMAMVASAPQVVPEARAAWRHLADRRS